MNLSQNAGRSNSSEEEIELEMELRLTQQKIALLDPQTREGVGTDTFRPTKLWCPQL